jgi:nicotinamidase-related amidase
MSARHPHVLLRSSATIFVVDIQERFRPHIAGFADLVAATELLVRGAQSLGIPVAYSEQYPAGLGVTVPELAGPAGAPLTGAPMFEKMEISSRAAVGWNSLPPTVRDAQQIVIAGIETHVCISQTVHDLLADGKQVHIAVDAVGSRSDRQRDIALERLRAEGAVLTSVEMALFELLGIAGTPEFKTVQGLIKEYDAARARELSNEEVHA